MMNAKFGKWSVVIVIGLLLLVFGLTVAYAADEPQGLPAMPDAVVEFKAIRETRCFSQPAVGVTASLTLTKGIAITGDLLFYDEDGGIWFRQGAVGNNYGWVAAENWCPIMTGGTHYFQYDDKQRPLLAELIQVTNGGKVNRTIGWTRTRDIPTNGLLLPANTEEQKSRFGYVKGNPLLLTANDPVTGTQILLSTGAKYEITGTTTLESNIYAFWFQVTNWGGQAVLNAKKGEGKVIENTQVSWIGDPQGVDPAAVITGGTFHLTRGGSTDSFLAILAKYGPWLLIAGVVTLAAAFGLPRIRALAHRRL